MEIQQLFHIILCFLEGNINQAFNNIELHKLIILRIFNDQLRNE